MAYLIDSATKEKKELSNVLKYAETSAEITVNTSGYVEKNGYKYFEGTATVPIPSNLQNHICVVGSTVITDGWMSEVLYEQNNKVYLRVMYRGTVEWFKIEVHVGFLYLSE